jgi:hypothetical protein
MILNINYEDILLTRRLVQAGDVLGIQRMRLAAGERLALNFADGTVEATAGEGGTAKRGKRTKSRSDQGTLL